MPLKIANSVTDLIGNTPFLRLNRLSADSFGERYLSSQLYAHLEV